MLYIDPLGLDTAGITWWLSIPEVVAGGDNSMAYVSAMEAGRAAGDRARREANFNNGMQEAYSGRGSSTVSKAELEERRRAEQAAARYRAYVANRSNYGRNAYSPSLGPQTADEWETFGDVLGASEIPLAAQLGDLISLGANIIKGSRSGMLMSAAGFIPFGSQFKLAAKTGTQVLLKPGAANLTQKGLDHIVVRHWFTSSAKGAGKFAEGTTGAGLKGMINTTTTQGVFRANTGGRAGTIAEYNFDRVIGTTSGGAPASNLRVVIGSNGNVITAFPY